MLKNYLLVTIRSLLREKFFVAINVIGLAVGMAACILIAIYVRHELNFESFQENRDTLYRVLVHLKLPWSDNGSLNMTPPALAPAMVAELPEVVNATQIHPDNVNITFGDQVFEEKRFFFVQPEFLQMFSFPLAAGDSATVLREPYQVLITQTTAKKLFGQEDPIGKVLRFGTVFNLTVVGVLKDPPEDSHIQFDYLASSSTREDYWKEDAAGQYFTKNGINPWHTYSGPTYFQLRADVDLKVFTEKFMKWVAGHYPPEKPVPYEIQPISDIRLKGDAIGELSENTDPRYIYFVAGMALFILLIAVLNYMNLSTARCTKRVREVGMRKVLGATRSQLITRFMGESLLLTCVALALGLVLVELWLPRFNLLVGQNLEWSPRTDWLTALILCGVCLVSAILAGIYPAAFLSSAHPIEVLKGKTVVDTSGTPYLRRLLVVFQFVVSAGLAICTLVVVAQLSFMEGRDLGYRTDGVVSFKIKEFRLKKSFHSLKEDLKRIPGIVKVAGSMAPPSETPSGASASWWEGKEGDASNFFLNWTTVDYDFLDLYDMKLVDGRGFQEDFAGDEANYILNEAAVKAIGWTDAVGRKFSLSASGAAGTVIGVVKDFNFESLHRSVTPLAMKLERGQPQVVSMLIEPDKLTAALEAVRTLWSGYGDIPIEFSFIKDDLAAGYRREQRLRDVFSYAAVLALLIAGLGMAGLAAYTTEQRSREISLRKVMGSSSSEVIVLLVRQFLAWVVVANLIAWPLAYWVMTRWQENFAYRVGVTWTTLLLASGVTLLIATTAILVQVCKAAQANPIEALRHE
jgi:putative ABC transport system permease protein